MFIALGAIGRRVAAWKPSQRNAALGVRVESIRRFQGFQLLGLDDEPAAINFGPFQIVGVLRVERLGDLLVGEDYDADLLLLRKIECDRH